MAKCAACNQRKGKRNCPALGKPICSLCCGRERGAQIDCPSDCSWLDQSQAYRTARQDTEKLADFEREMKSIVGKEHFYEKTLHNVEYLVHRMYARGEPITDRQVETALEWMLEHGKSRLNLPSRLEQMETPSGVVKEIVAVVTDAVEFKSQFRATENPEMERLKIVYRVLDSVRTHKEAQDECSYLDFIGMFVGD